MAFFRHASLFSQLSPLIQAREKGTELSSGYAQSFKELTGHISEEHSLFFDYWMRFTELEDREGRLKDEHYVPTVFKGIRGTLVEFLTDVSHEKLRRIVINLAHSEMHDSPPDQKMVRNQPEASVNQQLELRTSRRFVFVFLMEVLVSVCRCLRPVLCPLEQESASCCAPNFDSARLLPCLGNARHRKDVHHCHCHQSEVLECSFQPQNNMLYKIREVLDSISSTFMRAMRADKHFQASDYL